MTATAMVEMADRVVELAKLCDATLLPRPVANVVEAALSLACMARASATPPDGNTTATLPWLDSLGGTPGTSPAGYRYVDFTIFQDGDDREFLRIHDPGQDSDGVGIAAIYSQWGDGVEDGIGMSNAQAKTRDQVRRLLDALGAKYKELS